MAKERLLHILNSSLAALVGLLLYIAFADAARGVLQQIYRTIIFDYQTLASGIPVHVVLVLSKMALISNAALLVTAVWVTAVWFVCHSACNHAFLPLFVSIYTVVFYGLMMNSPDAVLYETALNGSPPSFIGTVGWQAELSHFKAWWMLLGFLCPFLGWELGRRRPNKQIMATASQRHI